MDFPICPSCGQSVLDDEPEVCPFCGSSMKAKPGQVKLAPKPPAAKPAAPATPAAGKPSAGARPAGARPSTDDDSPFGVGETTQAAPVATASPAPMKGKSYEIRCPMCETVGYVPRAAIGKPVKCANPKCLIPVFEVPPEPEAPPPPPPPKPNRLPFIAGATVVVLAAGGGAAYFLASQPAANTTIVKPLDEDLKELLKEKPSAQPVVKDGGTKPEPDKTQPPVATAVVVTPAEWISKSLQLMIESSTKSGRQNRSKAFCRQQLSISYSLSGDVTSARAQLDNLQQVGADVPYFRIPCLIAIAWQELAAGQAAAAAKSVDAALADTARLPKVGRAQLEDTTAIAAGLVAVGRAPEGQAFLNERQKPSNGADIAGAMQIVRANRSFDLDAWHRDRPLATWTAPQGAAVVAVLVGQGKDDLAWTFVEQQTGTDVQADCAVEWSRQTARLGRVATPEVLVQKFDALGPAVTIRALAAHASAQQEHKAGATLTAYLQKAEELAAGLQPPTEPVLPATRQIVDLRQPPEEPLIQSAVALAQLARIQVLAGQQEPAVASLQKSLLFARGLAPTQDSILPLAQRVGSSSAAQLGDQIRDELKIKSSEEVRLTVNAYRRNVDTLAAAASDSTQLQVSILARAVEWGLATPVWDIVSSRTTETEDSKRLNLVATELPGVLVEAFRTAKQAEPEKAVLDLWKQLQQTDAPPRPALEEISEAAAAGHWPQAVELLYRNDPLRSPRDLWAQVVAARLVRAKQTPAALTFISSFPEIVLREECYELAASLAASQGDAAAIWKQVEGLENATEKVALCRGLISGLVAAKPAP